MTEEEIDFLVEQMLAGQTIESDDEVDDPEGQPLAKADIEDATTRLSRWQTPAQFSDDTMSLCRRSQSEEYFNRPYLNFLQDAYVLAKFARLVQADEVRLAAREVQWPDGLIKLAGVTHDIEITSTHGGRLLGKEYREVQGLKFDSGEEWVKRAEAIPYWLDHALALKAGKQYGAPCWLVVYLNISEYGIRQKETETTIGELKEKYAKSFARMTVLWKGKLY